MDMTITRDRFDAVLFDLDGVLTSTAKVHAVCWKRTFDEFLERRAREVGEAFDPFDIDGDYKLYVDGRSRLDGIRTFLTARAIEIPEGGPDAPVDTDTVWRLSEHKNELVLEVIASDGVEPFAGAVALTRHLRAEGFKLAVVSASKNCAAVLAAAGIAELFDTRVDGMTAAEENIAGKPAPDMFLEAARRLGVTAERAVVVEDAIAGVQAGRDGHFGLVIGVDHEGASERLRQAGAHVVVEDLGQFVPAT